MLATVMMKTSDTSINIFDWLKRKKTLIARKQAAPAVSFRIRTSRDVCERWAGIEDGRRKGTDGGYVDVSSALCWQVAGRTDRAPSGSSKIFYKKIDNRAEHGGE